MDNLLVKICLLYPRIFDDVMYYVFGIDLRYIYKVVFCIYVVWYGDIDICIKEICFMMMKMSFMRWKFDNIYMIDPIRV